MSGVSRAGQTQIRGNGVGYNEIVLIRDDNWIDRDRRMIDEREDA